jgi:ribose/xylose/arabinose/galactoside ABC-type transport system permease subunit
MTKRQEKIVTTLFVAYTVFALSTFLLNNEAVAQEEIENLELTENDKEKTDQTGGYDFLGILAVPVATAIIGAIAASWGFIQTRWSGQFCEVNCIRVGRI